MKHILIALLPALLLVACGRDGLDGKDTETKSCCAKKAKATAEPAKAIASESIFQVMGNFQTQEGKPFTLSMLQGKPTVFGMVFTHCAYACPKITSDMKGVEDSLTDANEKVNFVLMSFDSERDTPERLKTFAAEMGLDARWILLHGDEEAVRTISVLLNVQYEKNADGNFSHSNLISVLDEAGVLKFQKEGLGEEQKETVQHIRELIGSK